MQKLTFPELDKKSRVAVALSGGADSMALLAMLAAYAQSRKKKLAILAITVDHALRPESAREAKKVARWAQSFPGVEHVTLRWEGQKPATGKMESARNARYALMADLCREYGIDTLAVAHHADDQAETFFMRVAHGSGLDGLSGMKRLTGYNEKLHIYRPLLEETHAALVLYCKSRKIKWVEDPTNADTRYTRARLREALAGQGFDARRMAVTMERLERAASALGELAVRFQAQATLEQSESACTLDLALLKTLPFEIALRVMRAKLEELGRGKYGPRLEKLEEIAKTILCASRKTKATLAGCLLAADPRGGRLAIRREAA